MNLREFLKKIPLDLGQAEYRHSTKASDIALGLAGKGNGKRAVDLGCGDGFWSEKLKSNGWQVVSIDKLKKYVDTIVHDLDNGIPLPDNSFDLVFSTAAIGYISRPEFFRQEIDRILKPGGRYVITTPNARFWADYALRPLGSSLGKLQDPNQKHYFKIRDIRLLFPGVKLYGYFPYAVFKCRISKMVSFLSPMFIIEGTKSKTSYETSAHK